METDNQSQEEVIIEDPKAVLSALERAKGDAKKFREEKEGLQKVLEETNEKFSTYTDTLLKEKVSAKIKEQGIDSAERFVKFLDMSKLELDENFDLIGFDEQIGQLKVDLPEIFDPKIRVGGKADGGVQESVDTVYSASEFQAMQVLGKI